jgi:hypothetical protein
MKATLIPALTAFALAGCVEVPPPPPLPGPPVVTVGPAYQPGYVVTSLPVGYRTVYYQNQPYYVHRNVYYRPYSGHRYVVVRRPY